MTGLDREHEPRRVVPLSPRHIREYQLPYVTGWRRRGLEPEAVYQLLYRLAHQIADQNVHTRVLLDENARIKRALCKWQIDMTRRMRVNGEQDMAVRPDSTRYDDLGHYGQTR